MDDRTTTPPDGSSPDHRTAMDGGREEERAMQLLQLLALRTSQAGEGHHPGSQRGVESSHTQAESSVASEPPRPLWLDAYVAADAEPDPAAAKTVWKGDKRLALGFAAALAGAVGLFFYYMTLFIQTPPPQVESAVPLPETSPSDTAAPATAKLVQQAMAECDREAKADPSALYLLLIPIRPNGDSARMTTLPGEAYETFFLVTSQATIEGLQTNSYATDSRPFGFAITDPATKQTKAWNFVTGVTKLIHKVPDGFSDFRVGFDLTGRGHGWQWSGQYSRNPGLCYWVNVHFRL